MSKSRFGRNIATMGTGILTGRVLSFLQGIILARLLGVTDLGKYAAILSICTILSRVMDFGLPHAFSYYLRKQGNSLGALLKVLLFNTMVTGVLALVAVFGLRYLPIPVMQELTRHFGWNLLFYLYLIAGTVVAILPNFVMASGQYARFVTFFNLGIVIQILMQFALYLARGSSLQSFLIANLAGMAVMAAILSTYLIRSLRTRLPPVRVTAREVYGFGLRSHWGVLMKLSSAQLELPLISSVAPSGSVGHYSVSNTFREAAMMPQSLYSGIFHNTLVDKASGIVATKTDPLLVGLIFQFLLALSIAGLAWAILPSLIPIVYGPSFAPAGEIAVLLVLSTVFSGPTGLCWIGFCSMGRPQLMSLISTISGLLSPVMIWTMAVDYGLIGAGWASVSVAFITFLVSLAMTIKLNRYRFHDFQQAFRDSHGIIPRILSRA